MILILQIHDTQQGWLDAAELSFPNPKDVHIEYDVDYAGRYLGRRDQFALSITNPVSLTPYRGPIPGYLIDLIPQGQVLARLLARHGIQDQNDFQSIFSAIPLASPGNIRIKQAWQPIEQARPRYDHKGFTRQEILTAHMEFLLYMEEHGAPVGGTSGAAGGAPKFLLREDHQGRYHAEGYLDDDKTKQAWLIKFPFTDSRTSKLLLQTEQAFYDVLSQLGLQTYQSLEWEQDVLFIPRFDRVRGQDNRLHYFGLESFYAAHGINSHGLPLNHEDNLTMISDVSHNPTEDVIEYFKRDLINQALANSDNHGRNSSLLKGPDSIRLSPLYDVTAMKFFEGDFIIPLTRWQPNQMAITKQLEWIEHNLNIDYGAFKKDMVGFASTFASLDSILKDNRVSDEIIAKTSEDRSKVLTEFQQAVRTL